MSAGHDEALEPYHTVRVELVLLVRGGAVIGHIQLYRHLAGAREVPLIRGGVGVCPIVVVRITAVDHPALVERAGALALRLGGLAKRVAAVLYVQRRNEPGIFVGKSVKIRGIVSVIGLYARNIRRIFLTANTR